MALHTPLHICTPFSLHPKFSSLHCLEVLFPFCSSISMLCLLLLKCRLNFHLLYCWFTKIHICGFTGFASMAAHEQHRIQAYIICILFFFFKLYICIYRYSLFSVHKTRQGDLVGESLVYTFSKMQPIFC